MLHSFIHHSLPFSFQVPLSGHVKLRVTSVINATLYCAHVVRCKVADTACQSQYDEIAQKLSNFFG